MGRRVSRSERMLLGGHLTSLHLLVEFLFETPQAFGVLGDRPDIFLEDDVLRRGRTDHFREPAQVGCPV